MVGVTDMRSAVVSVAGVLVVAGLVVAAVVAGRRGIELVSWLAGIGSFIAAVAALSIAAPKTSGLGRMLRFSARARDNSQVFQAGGNITNAGNNPRKP
jgi:hypothetical protein